MFELVVEKTFMNSKTISNNEDFNIDSFYMSLAYLYALKSQDPNTKLAAVVVDSDNTICGLGCIDFPQGITTNKSTRLERPEKYYWMVHAEENAIFDAINKGTSVKGCKMYTPSWPCAACAKTIIQAGIKEIVLHKTWVDQTGWTKWDEDLKRSQEMLKEAGVIIRIFEGRISKLYAYKNGKRIAL